MAVKTIKVDYLARVEGEGAFKVVVRDGVVESAELSIFEPPRFFEAFLRGRAYSEAPDITARICGICPVAYQMSSIHAMEHALGVQVTGPLRDLRRLLYCGEWIESHTLHIYMLHAPDFLGYEGAIDMARDHGDAVRRGLALKKAGNEILTLLGGREIHPINVRVGGFYRTPRRRELEPLAEKMKWARDAALETVRWVAASISPTTSATMSWSPCGIPTSIRSTRVGSSPTADSTSRRTTTTCTSKNPTSSARLRCIRGCASGARTLLDPLARYSLNFARLSPTAQQAAREAGLGPACANPYRSIIVRAVEVLYACDEALRIIDAYEQPDRPAVRLEPCAGVGCAATEAPRGLLYHRYRLEADGTIAEARIVPPTSQNQASIEADLASFVGDWLDLPDDELRHRCEQTVRNYDPCISCSTHFLRLELDRG